MTENGKRAFKRHEENIVLRYILYNSDDKEWHIAFTENISLGGLYFISIKKMLVGDKLNCFITLTNKNVIKCIARIVRVETLDKNMIKTFGYGIEFSIFSEKTEKYLIDFMKK